MEKNREGKRRSFAAVNGIGLSRRRHRITALRDSPEEDGKMETVRLRERERVHKMDRVGDREKELMDQPKRRRMGRKRDVEGGWGGDEDSCSPSGEENYEEDYEEPSSTMSNHVLRKTITPIRNFRSISVSRIVDDMIGVLVPRKARSASAKRLNEQWISSPCGFGERQTRRRISQSPLGGSVDSISPSTASGSHRRKMKPLGSKGLISKVSRKPLPSVEDDIEIEVVEALFDLMKQSHSLSQSQSFNKDESIRDDISTENLDLIGNADFHTKSVHSRTISGQIGLKAPDLPPEITSTSTAELNTESESKIGKMLFDAPESTDVVSLERGKNSCEPTQESVGGDQVIVPKGDESESRENSNGDGSLDSRMLKASLASEVVMPSPKGEANFEIDLMAPPPIPSSPDQDGSKITLFDLKLDLEKSEQENISSCSCSYNNFQQRGPEEPDNSTLSDSKRHKFGQLNSLPSPVVATGWPGTFPPPGCISPLKTLLPVVESSGTTSLIAPFTLSQPRPKRCVTHQDIACNIRQHQQRSKNCVLPPATAPASLHEAKPSSGNPTNSTLNSFLGNTLPGDLPGRHALATTSILSVKGKSSEVANADATKSKQLVPQQTLDQAPASNLLQPALIFPLGQNQVANVAAQQPGLNKSVGVMSKVALSSNPARLPVIGSLSLPAGEAAMSFNCANLSASDASRFMTILQGNVQPYSSSTNSGMSLPIRGAQAPVFPFLSASYYPSMFCTIQNQRKQSTCQPLSEPLCQIQQASSTAGTCSGSKSSYKQSKSHQQIVAQTSNHNSFVSERVQLEQSQKQHALGSHSSIKSVDISGSQKDINAQNYRIPFQTLDFAPASHGEGNQRQLGSEHTVAVIPSQAIGFSFDLNASTKKGFNFSAPPQETAVVEMLSDVAQLGYQFVPSVQVAQHKNFQVAEKRNVFDSTNTDEEKKPLTTLNFSKLLDCSNLSASAGENVALDGPAQYQSSLPPPTTRNQSFSSSSPTATFSVTVSKSQQEQQQKETIQLQKQFTQEKQVTSSAQVQAPISNNYNYSFSGCNNPNNNLIFPLVHNNNFVQSFQWKNTSVATTAQVPSLATTSSFKNLPKQQSRNSQGQPHVSFESSLNSAVLLQGQQFILNSKPTSSIVDGHLEVAT